MIAINNQSGVAQFSLQMQSSQSAIFSGLLLSHIVLVSSVLQKSVFSECTFFNSLYSVNLTAQITAVTEGVLDVRY